MNITSTSTLQKPSMQATDLSTFQPSFLPSSFPTSPSPSKFLRVLLNLDPKSLFSRIPIRIPPSLYRAIHPSSPFQFISQPQPRNSTSRPRSRMSLMSLIRLSRIVIISTSIGKRPRITSTQPRTVLLSAGIIPPCRNRRIPRRHILVIAPTRNRRIAAA
jgi:hypothetical protein